MFLPSRYTLRKRSLTPTCLVGLRRSLVSSSSLWFSSIFVLVSVLSLSVACFLILPLGVRRLGSGWSEALRGPKGRALRASESRNPTAPPPRLASVFLFPPLQRPAKSILIAPRFNDVSPIRHSV